MRRQSSAPYPLPSRSGSSVCLGMAMTGTSCESLFVVTGESAPPCDHTMARHSRPPREPLLADSPPLVSAALQADDAVPCPTSPAPKRVSLFGMTLNLVTGGLGSGILTLSWGMAGASVVVALVLTLAVVALNGFTVMLLVHAAEAHKKFDLGSLVSVLPGRWPGPIAQGAFNALVWFTMWMTLLGYIIIVQDCLTSLFPSRSVLASRWLWAVLSSAVVLPLSWMDLQVQYSLLTTHYLLLTTHDLLLTTELDGPAGSLLDLVAAECARQLLPLWAAVRPPLLTSRYLTFSLSCFLTFQFSLSLHTTSLPLLTSYLLPLTAGASASPLRESRQMASASSRASTRRRRVSSLTSLSSRTRLSFR